MAKYRTPSQVADEVAASVARIKRLNRIASELYPLPNGELRTSFKGLTDEQRDKVRNYDD